MGLATFHIEMWCHNHTDGTDLADDEERVEDTSGVPLAPHRIHAHIAITVLSLLLERAIEHACQDTWRSIRDDLKHIQLALLSSPNGRAWQVTEPSLDGANRLKAMKIKPPKPILNLD